MRIIVGLGNPETKYDGSRHNIGFALLDDYARSKDAAWKNVKKFKALTAELPSKDLLIKPTTYYNLSGETVRAVIDFYKISPEDVLVIHDDHAVELGVLRLRSGSSDAGNNGIKSINAHAPGTKRLRVGTHSELHRQTNDTDYVLSKFSREETEVLSQIRSRVFAVIDDFLRGTFTITTYK